jgi:hypothetical protein
MLRPMRPIVVLLACAFCAGLACGETEAPPAVQPQASAGVPDSCALLGAADPKSLLRSEVGEPFRIYGLCRVERAGAAPFDPEHSAALEVRSDAASVPASFDAFWELEGGGVGLAGGLREQVAEIPGLGDYALWHPITRGLRLFAYARPDLVVVVTVVGVPTERALPWAQTLARDAVSRAAR